MNNTTVVVDDYTNSVLSSNKGDSRRLIYNPFAHDVFLDAPVNYKGKSKVPLLGTVKYKIKPTYGHNPVKFSSSLLNLTKPKLQKH